MTRINKSKATLLAETQIKEELLRRKKRVRDELYPVLNETPFYDAASFLSGTQSLIRAIFMDTMREKKFNDFSLKATMGSPFPELTETFVEMLKDESVESGLWMLGQVEKAIQEFRDHEVKGRKVGSFKPEFSDF